MKVTKISAVTLSVSDMKKSVDFYSKIPNFKIVYGGSDNQFTSFLIEDATKSYLNLKLIESISVTLGDVPKIRVLFFTSDPPPCSTVSGLFLKDLLIIKFFCASR